MNPALPNHVKSSRLLNHAGDTQGLGQNLFESIGIAGAGDEITGAPGVGDVRPLISDQFTAIRREDAKLQSSSSTREERILLPDRLRAGVAEPNGDLFRRGPVLQDRLDLDVRRQGPPSCMPSLSFEELLDLAPILSADVIRADVPTSL